MCFFFCPAFSDLGGVVGGGGNGTDQGWQSRCFWRKMEASIPSETACFLATLICLGTLIRRPTDVKYLGTFDAVDLFVYP